MEQDASTSMDEKEYMDPVCGMMVTPSGAAGKHEYKGATYYFCSPGCLRSFHKDPEHYLSPDYKPTMD